MNATLFRVPANRARTARAVRAVYRLPAQIGRRRRRGRLLRRLLFCAGLAMGAFVVAALVWGVIQALNED